MNLLTYLLGATSRWAFVFPQERSLQRAIALAFGILCGVGRRTVTRAISFHGSTFEVPFAQDGEGHVGRGRVRTWVVRSPPLTAEGVSA